MEVAVSIIIIEKPGHYLTFYVECVSCGIHTLIDILLASWIGERERGGE